MNAIPLPFFLLELDARPMCAGMLPSLSSVERYETLEASLEAGLMMWPEDGAAPLLVYNVDGTFCASITPVDATTVVVVRHNPTYGKRSMDLWYNVQYDRDTSGRIVATTMEDRNGVPHRLTHPA